MCKNKDELNVLVAKRRKLASIKKKVEERLKDIDHEIIEYAQAKGEKGGKDQNTYIVFGDSYKVSCIIVTQHPLDGDKLKALLGDKITEFQKTNTYSKLDIR